MEKEYKLNRMLFILCVSRDHCISHICYFITELVGMKNTMVSNITNVIIWLVLSLTGHVIYKDQSI